VTPGASDLGVGGDRPASGRTIGTVAVGRYLVEVGAPSGMAVALSTTSGVDAQRLERALDDDAPGAEPEGPGAALGAVVGEASEVTAKAERALDLFRALAEGRVLNPSELSGEVDALVTLLERLDREGRWRDALGLARSLSALLALLMRWQELARLLGIALQAANKLGDLPAVAWAQHELGSLHLVAENHSRAERRLDEARELRERLGDRGGLAATERNLQVLCRRLRELVRDRRLMERSGPGLRGWRRRALLAIAAATLLVAGGVAGAVAADLGGDGGAPATEVAGGAPTISIRVPAQGARYDAGTRVVADYRCSAGKGGPPLRSCAGSVPDGKRLDTSPGRHTFAVTATGADGQQTTKRLSYSAARSASPDRTKPTIRIVAPRPGALGGDSSRLADYSCQDEPAGSGIVTCQGDVPNGQPVDVSPGTHTFMVTAVDRAGNTARQTVTYRVSKQPPVDTLKPSVVIASPAAGRVYFVGESVLADFGCSDEAGGSGIASCDGPVEPGKAVSTTSTGSFSFTVTALDRAGNATERTVTYRVAAVPGPD
jgi:hypothetical protein